MQVSLTEEPWRVGGREGTSERVMFPCEGSCVCFLEGGYARVCRALAAGATEAALNNHENSERHEFHRDLVQLRRGQIGVGD